MTSTALVDLRELLAAGRMKRNAVVDAMARRGWSEHQANRAKRALAVRTIREGYGLDQVTWWELTDDAWCPVCQRPFSFDPRDRLADDRTDWSEAPEAEDEPASEPARPGEQEAPPVMVRKQVSESPWGTSTCRRCGSVSMLPPNATCYAIFRGGTCGGTTA